MKNFKVNGDLGEFELHLPESLEEIPVDYLPSFCLLRDADREN